MANYINKYATQAAYEADETKQYPNVSYIESTNAIVFAETEPQTGITGNAPTYGVVYGEISGYSGYSYDEVYQLYHFVDGSGRNAWYMLNNLDEYEKYGVYGNGRNITTYEGKLTVDNGYEYQYSGGSWVNVGQTTSSSGIEFSKTLDVNTSGDFQYVGIPTSFKILKSEINAIITSDGGFSCSLQGQYDQYGNRDSMYFDNSYYNISHGIDQYTGTVTEDGDYLVYEIEGIDSFFIEDAQYYASLGFTFVFDGSEIGVKGDYMGGNQYFWSGATVPTSFKIPASQINEIIQTYGSFQMDFQTNGGGYYQISDSTYTNGQVTNDGNYYIYTMTSPSTFDLDAIIFNNDAVVNLIFENGVELPVEYVEKAAPDLSRFFTSVSAMSESQNTFYGQYAIIANDVYDAENCTVYEFIEGDVYEEVPYSDYIYAGLYLGNKAQVVTTKNWANTILSNAFTKPNALSSTTITSASIGGAATKISFNAFMDTAIKDITIPSGITKISFSAFTNCSVLSACTIEGSGLTEVDFYSFDGCSSLTSVTLPSSLTKIGTRAFRNCSGLTSITIYATTPPTLETGGIENTNSCPIYVPAESVDAYKAANNWKSSSIVSRIQAIP